MLALWTKVTTWIKDEKGASMVEYALLVVLIAIIAIVAIRLQVDAQVEVPADQQDPLAAEPVGEVAGEEVGELHAVEIGAGGEAGLAVAGDGGVEAAVGGLGGAALVITPSRPRPDADARNSADPWPWNTPAVTPDAPVSGGSDSGRLAKVPRQRTPGAHRPERVHPEVNG